jgi:4-methylaminobutanoate oxidase (formaldehyde-forming)
MVKQLAIDGQRCHYALARPSDEARMGRLLRRSPVHAALAAAGAHCAPSVGWEVAEYFTLAAEADPGDCAEGEYVAAKQAAILVDDSMRAKFAVMGSGAEAALRSLFPACVLPAAGEIATVFAQNSMGGIDCGIMIIGQEDDGFLLTTPALRSTYLQTLLRHGLAGAADVTWLDVSSGSAVFVLSGPAAPAMLEPLLEAADPLARTGATSGYLAGAPVRLLPTTPYGEPGFEIHVSSDYAAYVFEALREAGAPSGLRLAGTKAVDALRIENGIPAFGKEIDGRTTLAELGLFMPPAGEAAGRFLKRFFVAGSAYLPKGREGVLAGERRVGSVTSAAYSPLAAGSFILAFVDGGFANATGLQMETRDGKIPIVGCGKIFPEH